ncbi:hypothetical protein WDM22_28685 [Bradyrhizobium septentrionale]|uniref:Uncharacterized protein n=1 Tax=Bradyrhizobium septentrionale TaxID=1404411 RepID=A0ABZ2P7G1_9BRAD
MPSESDEVVKVATPPLTVPVPIGVPPSENVTVPVGDSEVEIAGVMVAVNVTDWPTVLGLADDANAVVVELGSTRCATAEDVLVV